MGPVRYSGNAVFTDDFVLHDNVLHSVGNIFLQVNRIALGAGTWVTMDTFGVFICHVLSLKLPLRQKIRFERCCWMKEHPQL